MCVTLQILYEKGGRKFGFLSLSPLGCLPALRALNPGTNKDGCFEAASALALAHNNALSNVLRSLDQVNEGFMYTNSNFYDWLQDRIDNPTNYGMYNLQPSNKNLHILTAPSSLPIEFCFLWKVSKMELMLAVEVDHTVASSPVGALRK